MTSVRYRRANEKRVDNSNSSFNKQAGRPARRCGSDGVTKSVDGRAGRCRRRWRVTDLCQQAGFHRCCWDPILRVIARWVRRGAEVCYTPRVCGGGVYNAFFSELHSGVLRFCLRSPPYLFVLRGDNVLPKYIRSPRGDNTEDMTHIQSELISFAVVAVQKKAQSLSRAIHIINHHYR